MSSPPLTLLLRISQGGLTSDKKCGKVSQMKKTITYEIQTKLPEWATPEALKALNETGKSLRELAKMAGVSYETIRRQILKVG